MLCRMCHEDKLVKFLDLGFTPPADDFLTPSRLQEPEVYYPLEVCICDNCSLVQLSFTVPPEILFQRDYPYESSTTRTLTNHFHSMSKQICDRFSLCSDDLVIDIGSNVGVLLQGFKNGGAQVLGIEPAGNICAIACKNGIDSINEFISEDLCRRIVKTGKKAKIVTGTNVIAHIHDQHALVRSVKTLLDDKGVFIFEAPYLLNLMDNFEYDTIYHEHLGYLSVKPVRALWSRFGMELFDVQEVTIHGGSLRYFIARAGDYPVSENLGRLLRIEEERQIYKIATLRNFAGKVEKNREDLVWLLRNLKRQGKRIAAVSTPAKGMTLLNYCKIGTETIDFATEKSPLKIGKYTPGIHIPIYPDSELIKRRPDYALLLAWNFAEEIMKNLGDYRKAGGKFIIPIPEPRIVE